MNIFLPKHKQGSILIPLVVILTISMAVLFLSKYLSSSQANVETAIDSRYQASLSSKMDQPNSWSKEEVKNQGFVVFFPKQWVGSAAPKPKENELYTLEKFLSKKVKLKITVYAQYDIPKGAKEAKFDKNTYFMLKDTEEYKSAVTKTEKLYYQIELSQDNYFTDEVEFKGTYFQLLKKFQVNGK